MQADLPPHVFLSRTCTHPLIVSSWWSCCRHWLWSCYDCDDDDGDDDGDDDDDADDEDEDEEEDNGSPIGFYLR